MSLFCLTVCIYLHAVSACAELHLQVTIPPEGPACPGKKLVLTCRLNSMPRPKSVPPTMFWEQAVGSEIQYYNGNPPSATFGDFCSTAHFSNSNYNIVSNATLDDLMLSHNGIHVSCSSFSSKKEKTIRIAGVIDAKSLYICSRFFLF